MDKVLDELGSVDLNQLLALGRILVEEGADLLQEAGDFCLSVTVTQPGFEGRDDPLAELATTGVSGKIQRVCHDVLENLLARKRNLGVHVVRRVLAGTEVLADLLGTVAIHQIPDQVRQVVLHPGIALILENGHGGTDLGQNAHDVVDRQVVLNLTLNFPNSHDAN